MASVEAGSWTSSVLIAALFVVLWRALRWLWTRNDFQQRYNFTALTPVSPSDSIWLLENSGNNMYINCVMVTDPIDVAFLQNVVKTRGLNRYPRLHCRLTFVDGSPYWDPIEVDIDHHIANAPVDNLNAQQLQEYMSTIWDKQLDPKHPLWQYRVVQNYEGDKTAIIFRVHHVYGDGIALMRYCLATMDEYREEEKKKEEQRRREKAAKDKQSGGESLSAKVPRVGLPAQSFLRLALSMLTFPVTTVMKLFVRADTSLLHGPAPSGIRAVSWAQRLSLKRIKEVKNELKCSVNDVLMGCMAGALRTYVLKHDSKAKVEDMIVNVPVSFRRDIQLGVLNNEITLIWLRLAASETTPVRRVRAMQQRMNNMKQSVEPMGNFFMTYILGFLPFPVARFLLELLGDKTTGVLTNVPGPTVQLTAFGKRIHDLIFWVPSLASIAVGMSILSYNGGVRIGVSTDRVVCEKPNVICAAFEEEFEQLYRDTCGKKQ